MEEFNRKTHEEYERIVAADLPEMERFIQAFDWITRRIVTDTDNEIQLARAMHDDANVVKQQIKKETIKLVRGVFEGCYLRVTGERTRLWED